MVVPLVLAAITPFAAALGSRDRVFRVGQFVVGVDLCLEAFAINLAFGAWAATESLKGTGMLEVGVLLRFMGSTLAEFILFLLVMVIQRFGPPGVRSATVASGIGVVALISTMAFWTAL